MFKIPPVARQFLTIICCNVSSFAYGTISGWPTINLIELLSDNSPYPASNLALEEATLVISVAYIGGLVGNFFVLPIGVRFGIKRTIHCLGIPLILSSFLIIWAQNKYYLIVSRILSGLAGGCIISGLPSFTNDIAFDNVRGTLNSMFDLSLNLGLLFSFILGIFFDCIDQAKIQLFVPVFFVIILFFIPESPEYYVRKNNKLQAIKSVKFFKGQQWVAKRIDHFMKQTHDSAEKGKMNSFQSKNDEKLTIKDFLTPQAKRAILVAFTLMTLGDLGGVLSLVDYTTAIFAKTGSSMSEKASTSIISLVLLISNLLFTFIVDRFNRKTLFIVSAFFTGVIYIIFGFYCEFLINTPGYEWMAPVCLSLIVLISGFGYTSMPYIVTMEIFPRKIRNACTTPAMSFMWIVLFVIGTTYPLAENKFGLSACLFFFGTVCFSSIVFALCFMPETRGKSNEEIMDILSSK